MLLGIQILQYVFKTHDFLLKYKPLNPEKSYIYIYVFRMRHILHVAIQTLILIPNKKKKDKRKGREDFI